MRLRAWIVAASVTCLLASCGSLQDRSVGSNAGAAAKAISQLALVYIVQPDGRQDGSLFVHVTDAAGRALSPDATLGNFTRVQEITSNRSSAAVRSLVVAQKIDGTTTTIDIDKHATTPPTVETTLPTAAIDGTGSVFLASRGKIAQFNSAGAQEASFPLRPPAVGQRTVDGNPTKSVVDPNTARVGFVGRAVDGHVYATVDNSVNAAIVDLTANRRLDLAKIGYIEGGVSVGGALYLVLWDPSKTANHFSVARVETSTLRVTSEADLSINPSVGRVDSVEVVAPNDTSIIVYTSQATASGAHHSVVSRVDPTSLASTDVSVPDSAGLHVTVGLDGNLYLFGGVARGAVTRVDMTSWQSSPVTFADPVPAAAYVVAVFAR